VTSIYSKTLGKQEITREDILTEYNRLCAKMIMTGYDSFGPHEKLFCETLDKHFGTRIVPTASSFEGLTSIAKLLKKDMGLAGAEDK
jgi:hypothetical protein